MSINQKLHSATPVIFVGVVSIAWKYGLQNLLPVRDVRAVVLVMGAITIYLAIRMWKPNKWFAMCMVWFALIALYRTFNGTLNYVVATLPFLYLWAACALGLWAYESRCGRWIRWLGLALIVLYGASLVVGLIWKPWPHTPLQVDWPHVSLADNQPNATYLLAWSVSAAAPYAFPLLLLLPLLHQTLPVVAGVAAYAPYMTYRALALGAVALILVVYFDPPRVFGTYPKNEINSFKAIPRTQDLIRLKVLKKSIEVGFKHYITGFGLGSYRGLSTKLWPVGNRITFEETWASPNNTLVLAFFEGGLVGFALFLSGFLSLILSMLKHCITISKGKIAILNVPENVQLLMPAFICVVLMGLVYEVTSMPSLTALSVLTIGAMQRECHEEISRCAN